MVHAMPDQASRSVPEFRSPHLREVGRRHRVDLALALLVLVATAPIVQALMAQQASRLALTAALWDDGSVVIDGYPIGIDRAEREGHTYSDKAPGQPVLAVPAYAAYRALGGEPAREPRIDGNLGLWAVSVWSSSLAAALLAVLTRHAAARVDRGAATPVAVALTFGTLALPFATLLFGHALTAVLLLGGFLLVTEEDPSWRRLALAGVLLGAAVTVEYPAVLAAVLAAAYTFARHWRTHRWVALAAGALGPAVLLAAYNTAAFGNPLRLSYQFRVFPDEVARLGLGVVENPFWTNAVQVLAGERGLFVLTPVTLVALAGAILLLRDRRDLRLSATLGLGMFAVFLVLQLNWPNPTGGASPGPRYVVPGLAFLALPLAHVWPRVPLLARGATAIGVVTMGAATLTNPIVSADATGALGYWLGLLGDGELTTTVFGMAIGPWANALWAVLLAAAVLLLVRVERAERAALGDGAVRSRS